LSKLVHGAIRIGDSVVIDEFPEWGSLDRNHSRASPVAIHLYVNDADAVVERRCERGKNRYRSRTLWVIATAN
jgi:uncharacterized glyoxalase superfamily protein PhnB